MTTLKTAVRMSAWQKTPVGRESNRRANAKFRAKKKAEKQPAYSSSALTSAINFWGAA